MKLLSSLVSYGLVALVLASPVPDSPAGLDVYKLLLKSRFTQLDGAELSLNSSTVGVYGKGGTPLNVYPVESANKGRYSLHTLPIGTVDHALALTGPPSMLNFVDVANPSIPKPGQGPVYWETFGLDQGLVTHSGIGRWLANPRGNGDWIINWWDGSGGISGASQPVSITYIPI